MILLFRNLDILIIYDIFKLETIKFVYDTISKVNPPQFHDFFRYSQINYNTTGRRNGYLVIPQARTTTYGLNSIKNIGAHTWNDISQLVKQAVSRNSLITNIKKHIILSYT